MFFRRFVLPLVLVFALSATVLVLLYARADPKGRAGLESEAGKAMLQVIAAALIGNIVLLIVRDHEERRKAWLAKRDLLRADLTEGLLKLYSQVKGMRRHLRANVRVESASIKTIEKKEYNDSLEEISDIQLGLERYKREAQAGGQVGVLPKSVFGELRSMENYLGDLVAEWEEVLGSAGPSIEVMTLSSFSDFIGRGPTKFRTEFLDPYKKVVQAVAEEIEKDLAGG